MNIAWNYRREHLHPLQRSHYVISNGGDQPNVVPSSASVWYFIREVSADGIRNNFSTLHQIAEGASLMTDTSMSRRIVGAAYPRHFNRPIALAMDENIKKSDYPLGLRTINNLLKHCKRSWEQKNQKDSQPNWPA